MTKIEQFGEYLKAARLRKGMSLRAVENELDISNAYLSQLEQGKVKHPSPVVLHKLSQLYDLSYAEVMRLVGYPIPGKEEQTNTDIAARIGPVTEQEEEELIDYLRFLRSRRKGEE